MLLNSLSKITHSQCDFNVIFQGTWSTYLCLIYSGFVNYQSLLRQQLLLNLSRSCWHTLQGRNLSSGLCSQGSPLDVPLSDSWIIIEHIVLSTGLYVWCLMRQQTKFTVKLCLWCIAEQGWCASNTTTRSKVCYNSKLNELLLFSLN